MCIDERSEVDLNMPQRAEPGDPGDDGRDTTELREYFVSLGKASSTAERVYTAVVYGIETGRLRPPNRLAEESLAEVFGVSRTPVREALVRLEAENLVDRDRYGLYVNEITANQIIELYVIREALDGVAARLATRYFQPLDVQQLRRINERMRAAAEAGEYDEMAALNIEFHTVLARASKNQMVQRFVDQVHGWVRRFRTTTFAYPDRALKAVAEHDELLAAIEGRREEDAERLAREHMRQAVEIRIKIEAGGEG